VNDRGEALLARARTELDAAHTLEASDFPLQAASRAYYGAFYAAEAALLSLGETRSKHSGVISAFGLMVIKEGGFDPVLGGELRRLFELRGVATICGSMRPSPTTTTRLRRRSGSWRGYVSSPGICSTGSSP
jgi:uncharacterized protein (UPF0332 family)